MNTAELEKEIGAELDKEFTAPLRAPNIRPLSSVMKDAQVRAEPEAKQPEAKSQFVTLHDQWSMLERVDRELRERIRREKQELMTNYDRSVVEIETIYNIKIGDAIAAIETERREKLSSLADQFAQKIREHELLAKRMG